MRKEAILKRSTNIYSVGYAPASFPRDPININKFYEHMYLGQILEPLVESDRYGLVKAGVAESWKFGKKGLQIIFKLGDRKFSNGKKVTGLDVAYTIGRHLGTQSQSSLFLSDIAKVVQDEDGQVVIDLKNPNVAIIKALSRDQLGILPDGWKFDPSSEEPYIGTGPYRMILKESFWTLVPNVHFHDQSQIRIKNWVIKKLRDTLNEIPEGPIPDYQPLITQVPLDQLRNRPDFKNSDFEIKEVLSFSQTSFWIYPNSDLYKDGLARLAFCLAFDRAVESFALKHGAQRANGLIPFGILGHNPTKFVPKKIEQTAKIKSLRFAFMKGTFSQFVESESFRNFIHDEGFNLELIPWDATNIGALKGQHIDMITGSWAGGFNDPTGFLGLLPMVLGMDLGTYLGDELRNLLESAKAESDDLLRSEKFRKFDSRLVESGLLIPGWRTQTYSVFKKPLRLIGDQEAYTERFVNVVDR